MNVNALQEAKRLLAETQEHYKNCHGRLVEAIRERDEARENERLANDHVTMLNQEILRARAQLSEAVALLREARATLASRYPNLYNSVADFLSRLDSAK